MRYQIKVILKNKIAWLVVLFLALVSFPQMFQRMQPENRSDLNIRYERLAMEQESAYRSFGASIEIDPDYEANKEAFHAFHTMFKKQGEWYRELSGIYADGKVSEEEKKREQMINNLFAVLVMDVNANPKDGRPFFEDVFSGELEKMPELKKEIENLGFDTKLLHIIDDMGYRGYNGEREEKALYEQQKAGLAREFYLADKQIERVEESRVWYYLRDMFSMQESFLLLIPVVILLFCGAVLMEDRKNRSMGLLQGLPGKRTKLLAHYVGTVFTVVLGMFAVTIGVPAVFLGIRYGWSGLLDVQPVYTGGFSSFKSFGAIHTEGYGILGFGKWYPKEISPYMLLFPQGLSLYPLWKFFIRTGFLALLKVFFYILAGSVPVFLLRKKEMVYAGLLGLAVAAFLSRQAAEKLLWNPFSVGSAWDTTLGMEPFTWLRAVAVLLAGCILLMVLLAVGYQKRDISD